MMPCLMAMMLELMNKRVFIMTRRVRHWITRQTCESSKTCCRSRQREIQSMIDLRGRKETSEGLEVIIIKSEKRKRTESQVRPTSDHKQSNWCKVTEEEGKTRDVQIVLKLEQEYMTTWFEENDTNKQIHKTKTSFIWKEELKGMRERGNETMTEWMTDWNNCFTGRRVK